ncbi:hypothetical protein Tsubulata_008271 [Turnera subulata]|uniref:Uncharacterized protein n=1 Tax=Turnera subulata TaxID=218843 RepID=A0A9Q0FBH3_9ROSI|nr:hypothetical protein Tsubulata_008271 [Turnera subulata]
MTTVAESSPPPAEEKPIPQPPSDFVSTIKSQALEEATPWIDAAAEQARIYQKAIQEKLDTASARLSEIRSTSSAHFNQTIDSLKDYKLELFGYEDEVFGKIKEGVEIAVSHPLISSGIVAGSGLVLLKRPRRFLYYSALRRLFSEESLVAKADAKVKGLRESIELLQAESKKLEESALSAEAEFIRGRTKLRQAGKQIQGVIRSAYKIERQAAGLRDVLKELPNRQASKFRSEVSSLASEVKKERNTLSKEVTKISNYGISV